MQVDIFGGADIVAPKRPEIPQAALWPVEFQLAREREVIGLFISGHPLDRYKEDCAGCPDSIRGVAYIQLNGIEEPVELTVAAFISASEIRMSKRGSPYMSFTAEDHSGIADLVCFSDKAIRYRTLLMDGNCVALHFQAKGTEVHLIAAYPLAGFTKIQEEWSWLPEVPRVNGMVWPGIERLNKQGDAEPTS